MEFSLCCQLMGYQQEWLKYELMALERSSHLQVVGEELLIIAKLALSLAYMKLCLGNLSLATELGKSAFQLPKEMALTITRGEISHIAFFVGFRAHGLCQQLKKPKLDYIVLFDLFSALFLGTRYLCWMY